MAEATVTPGGLIQFMHIQKFSSHKRRKYHLGDPFTPPYDKGICAVINNDHADLSPIVGINSARRVDEGNSVLEGKTASWPDLRLKTIGQGYGNAGGNKRSVSRLKHQIRIHIGTQVHTSGVRSHVAGKREVRTGPYPTNLYQARLHVPVT